MYLSFKSGKDKKYSAILCVTFFFKEHIQRSTEIVNVFCLSVRIIEKILKRRKKKDSLNFKYLLILTRAAIMGFSFFMSSKVK